MREIKFRAWDRNEKVMAEVTSIHFSKSRYTMVKYRIKKNGKSIDEWSHIDQKGWGNVSLMKYTGFKNNNGVEIYEGYIVEWGHLNQWSREQPHRIAEVKFDPDIQFHSQVGVFNFGSFAYRDTTETDLEVIGNIYENKELLKEVYE